MVNGATPVIANGVKQSGIFAVFLDCFFASLIAMTSFVGGLVQILFNHFNY